MPSTKNSQYQLRETTPYRTEFLSIIDHFLAEGFPEFAEIFISNLEQKLATIQTFPNGFDQPFPDLEVRRANIGRYAIFFTTNNKTKEVTLLHILHSHRDLESLIS